MPRSKRSAASRREGSGESAREGPLAATTVQKTRLETRNWRITGRGFLGKGRGFVRSRAAGYPTGRAQRKGLGGFADAARRRAETGLPIEAADPSARPTSPEVAQPSH